MKLVNRQSIDKQVWQPSPLLNPHLETLWGPSAWEDSCPQGPAQ